MEQEKIGKFILKLRKKKNLTQASLAELLGVSEKSVSNWENGRNMPDLALLKPLCEILDVSINELLSGEELTKVEYQNKLEENIINTINYNNEKNKKLNRIVGFILLFISILLECISFIIFKSESSWPSILTFISLIIFLISIIKITNKFKYIKRTIICSITFILFVGIIFLTDYLNVLNNQTAPRFAYEKEYYDNMVIFKNPFYNVYQINKDLSTEYYFIDLKKEYDKNTVPKSPFNRNKAGIDNLIKYKYEYCNNKDNTKALIKELPMGEYLDNIEIDNDNNHLTINYVINYFLNDEYNFDYDLKTTYLYNIVSLFALLDNLEYITINTTSTNFDENIMITIDRDTIYNNYYGFKYIIRNGIDKYYFNEFLEKPINDYYFVTNTFKELIIDKALNETVKIEKVQNNNIKTINNKEDIEEIKNIIFNSNGISQNAIITLEASNLYLYFYNANDEVILKLKLYSITSCFGISGKEYCTDSTSKDKLYSIID